MDEIDYKLESANPVLISHAVSKLVDSIKKKKCDQNADHISKISEFKLLLTKKDSMDITLSISVCQALVALAEDGLWDINEALSTFASGISSMKNYTVAATTISHLLISDLKRNAENQTTYPFTLHAPRHPFVNLLTRDKRSWQTVLSQMSFIVNHRDPQIHENGTKMLRSVFLYILCDPSLDSMDCCMQHVWQLLIKSKHAVDLQTETLLWLCTSESHCCINTNYRILELTEKALLERNRENCTALLPMIASLTIQLLKQGSDPRANFDIMLTIIDHCETRIGNIMLSLMSEILVSCPAIYLYSTLRICTLIIKKMSCSNRFLYTLIACILKWIAYPSVLCSGALDTAKNLVNQIYAKGEFIDNSDTISPSGLFAVFANSDPYIQLYTELVHYLHVWKPNDILLWLEKMSQVPTDLKDKCKLLIAGLLLQTHDPNVTELCCNILIDVSRETKSFGSHVLSLVLHKLTKCRSSRESKCLLLAVPELAITKENIPIVNHTLDTLLNGDKQLKYFAIELYLKALRREPRCYRFISASIIRLMKADASWYSDATCARAMKYICEYYPEHGEKLVPLLSQILNRSTDTNGGVASALALGCISALCKASVIDISSTWRVLAPKMEKEKRTVVLESLCELLADIASYPPSQCSEEYDRLIENVISILWKYATCSDTKVAESALKALASFSVEQHILKTLPAEFRRGLELPPAYAKTPIDAARKPENVLPYIPGVCWIQMLQNISKAVLTSAGNLLISFIKEEVSSFRSGIYNWPQGEPKNFKYLPEKSVIRAVGEYLRRSDKSDATNHRVITECLRVFAYRYPKPLPNVNWCFLNDTINMSAEAKEYTLTIACRHAIISLSAKSFMENYFTSCNVSINDTDATWRNEYSVLYSNLDDICQFVQPNYIKPFLETTLEYVIEKMNLENEDSSRLFHLIMTSYAKALKNQEIHDGNSTLLYTILEKLLDRIDLTNTRFNSYFIAALELSMKHLERTTSPKVWWEVTSRKLLNAIAIRTELALRKSSSVCPLTWLNETMDETATSTSSVQAYFLGVIQKVQTKMQYEKSSSKWILNLMTQIQDLSMESEQDQNDKAQFYCNVLFVSIICLSGIDSMFMKQDLLIKTQEIRLKLFPQALVVLSDRQDWKYAIPQVMEWINCMRTSTMPSVYRSTFHRSLICLRHNAYYKDVWSKYLSIKTDIDF